jgi:DNA-binding transcriptional regulator YdaS (Cro superfamily)
MPFMKLADYISSNDMTLGAFARLIGVRNARTVQRYTKHGRVPSGSVLAAIARATNGAVQPSDFVDAGITESLADTG